MVNWFARVSLLAAISLIATESIPSGAVAQYNDDQEYAPPRYDRRQDPNWDHGPRDWGGRDGCSRRDVVDAARDEGFRRIDSIQMDGRRIVVRGWNDGGPDHMAFANRRGCPVVHWRG
jgi:hypothetical protein